MIFPFGHYTVCPKCDQTFEPGGLQTVYTHHDYQGDSKHDGLIDATTYGKIIEPHLRQTCGYCGFVWREHPRDYVAPKTPQGLVVEDCTFTNAKCDGNHGGPRCADPECWNQ